MGSLQWRISIVLLFVGSQGAAGHVEKRDGHVEKRATLGRVTMRLGSLYDARTDSPVAGALWAKEHLDDYRQVTAVINQKTRYSHSEALEDKMFMLGVSAELSLSFMSGMVSVSGSASVLKETMSSVREVSVEFSSEARVFQENLINFDNVDEHAMDLTKYATHVVVGVTWGADCVMKLSQRIASESDRLEVEGSLSAQAKNLPNFGIGGSINGSLGSNQSSKKDRVTISSVCDTLGATVGSSVDIGAVTQKIQAFQNSLVPADTSRCIEHSAHFPPDCRANIVPKTVTLKALSTLSTDLASARLAHSLDVHLVARIASMMEGLRANAVKAQRLKLDQPHDGYSEWEKPLNKYAGDLAHEKRHQTRVLRQHLSKFREGDVDAGLELDHAVSQWEASNLTGAKFERFYRQHRASAVRWSHIASRLTTHNVELLKTEDGFTQAYLDFDTKNIFFLAHRGDFSIFRFKRKAIQFGRFVGWAKELYGESTRFCLVHFPSVCEAPEEFEMAIGKTTIIHMQDGEVVNTDFQIPTKAPTPAPTTKAPTPASTPAPTPAPTRATPAMPAIVFDGFDYATMDGIAPTHNKVGCMSTSRQKPAGWSVSPWSQAIITNVIAKYNWGTHCLLLSDSTSWGTKLSLAGKSCGSHGFVDNGDGTYKVSSCSRRILIRRPSAEAERKLEIDEVQKWMQPNLRIAFGRPFTYMPNGSIHFEAVFLLAVFLGVAGLGVCTANRHRWRSGSETFVRLISADQD